MTVSNLKVHKAKAIFEKIDRIARQESVAVFAVGGFVRDLCLGGEGKDIDLLVFGDAIAFARAFRKRYRSGTVVPFEKFNTARVEYQDRQLEFVGARERHPADSVERPALEADLSRRDFTMNCLAMHLSAERLGDIEDPFNGQADLQAGRIKTPLPAGLTIADDPLRIMRAVRFAARFGFDIDPAVSEAIHEHRELLRGVSRERLTEEFRRILLLNPPSAGLELLYQMGITSIIFPEIDQMAGVEQRREYHHKDVLYHTLQVVDNISEKTDRFDLRLVALMHDIAKPQTKRFVEGVGWTFHGHEELGGRMVERIGRRMRLPKDTVKFVARLVRLHMRPTQLVDDEVTDSAIRRLLVEAGEDIDDLLTMSRADITSKNPRKVQRFLTNFDRLEDRLRVVEEKDRLRQFKPAFTGNDIMKHLGIAPGRQVGKIKQAIVDAILDGEIPNEYEACYEYFLRIKDRFMEGQ